MDEKDVTNLATYVLDIQNLQMRIVANIDGIAHQMEVAMYGADKLKWSMTPVIGRIVFYKGKLEVKQLQKKYNSNASMYNSLSQELIAVDKRLLSWYLDNRPEENEVINSLKHVINLNRKPMKEV
ncbi:MAG: hypothetical protein LKJ37_00975 [Ligilactobacillus acidipiscis]|jgi:hypothetical protein|nr:hypothetical protein [Ligilactobacillus acidipiscis]MCI1953543.1 hypothetical protein [Ligilactobacillus acidipiscis]